MLRLMRPTKNQWCYRFMFLADAELMHKSTMNILYDDTLYSNVELYMYMAEKQYDSFINVNICAYAYICLTNVAIHVHHHHERNEEKVVEITLEHNVSNSLVDNIRILVARGGSSVLVD